MPLYTFRRGEEVWEELMTYDAREQFLKDNPDVTVDVTSPRIVSGVTWAKPDKGFREVLGQINKNGRGRYKINDFGG